MLPTIALKPDFAPSSRVWAYVTDRPMLDSEIAQLQTQLAAFCQTWTAHNQSLKATAEIFGANVLYFMVDESQAGASGCSIDKSVHFLENIGAELNVDFFERMRFAWLNADGQIQWSDRGGLARAVSAGIIHPNTLMLNTLVQTKMELEGSAWVPFDKSWHRRLI